MILAAALPLGFDFTEPLALGLLALLPLAGLVALAGSTTAVRRRRFAAIAIRCTLLAALIFALSGARLTRASDRIAVVFLVDASDSVAADNAQAAQGWVNGALTTMPAGDQAAIILFGANATVERAMSEERDTDLFRTQPLGTATDIAAAIRLGLALFPDGASRRMVIISDGEANSGDTEAATMMAAANDVQISTVHLVRSETAETLVSDVRAPARARAGDTIDVEVRVESSQDTPATLRIHADGAPLNEREVQLRAGVNSYSIAVTVGERGFRTFTASIVTPDDADTTFQNNELSAFTDVSGPARALILEGTSGEGAPLVAALEAGGLGVDLLPATSAPDDLPSYASYDVTLLVNVPAQTLGSRMVTLQRYVRDLGRGLVVIGGDSSYGVGGYFSTPLEETLPVRMEIRDPEKLPQVSVNFTIDKSGSMGKCHGDGSGNQARVESGLPKTDLAKEATYQAISMLGPSDEVGIVAFDDTAVWIATSGPLSEQPDIASALASIQPEGGTNIYAGLAEAVDSMTASTGKVRHIILVTDGWSNTGNFDALLEQMAANDITLSVIGAGGGSATFLEELAERGGGRYYAVENPHDIPGIFLKETKIALRAYIVEGDIPIALGAPSPILDGISAVPNLRGYVSTTAKATAQTVLLSDRAEPVLAQWQYGLGRSVAWTSDAKNQWASGWVDWESFAPFWTNVARWAASAPGGDLQVSLDRQGDGATITVDSADAGGDFRNNLVTEVTVLSPDGSRQDLTLSQEAPGRYTGDVTGLTPGAHLLAVSQRGSGDEAPVAGATTGLIVGYSAEYGPHTGAGATTLERVSDVTGGLSIDIADPTLAFAHDLPAAKTQTPLWPWLILLAILLLPVDVAIRRLVLSRREWAALGAHLFHRSPQGGDTTGELRGASHASALMPSRRETRRPRNNSRPAAPVPETQIKPTGSESPAPPPQTSASKTPDRRALLDAKQRATRRKQTTGQDPPS